MLLHPSGKGDAKRAEGRPRARLVCPPACPPACLPARLPARLPACLRVRVPGGITMDKIVDIHKFMVGQMQKVLEEPEQPNLPYSRREVNYRITPSSQQQQQQQQEEWQ